MRRFLICGGIHGRENSLECLRRAAESCRPDGILFAGGVLDTSRQHAPGNTAWGLTPADARFVERFFACLGKLGLFSAVIPGLADTPLDDFLRLGMHAELEYPSVHLVHATLLEKGELAVCGMGGRLGAGPLSEPDIVTRTFVEYHLRPLWTARQPRKVLLLPAPPTGVLGGQEGNKLCGELIDSYHPTLCVVGGASECAGIERVASTLIVNPGYLADGYAAFLDWNRPGGEQAELLDLQNALSAAGMEVAVGD
jgi:Icc-related predicted phosphoesterase